MISLLWPIFYFIFIIVLKNVLILREKGQTDTETNSDLFYLVTQSLVDSCMSPAGEMGPQPWPQAGYQEAAITA